MRILLLLALCGTLSAQSSWKASGGWEPRQDKLVHAWAGGVVAGPAYLIARHFGASPKKAAVIAALTGLAVGIWKEDRYDRRRGGIPDPADAAYTGAGATLIAWQLKRQDERKVYAGIPRSVP